MEKEYKGKYRGLSKWEEKEYCKLQILIVTGIVLTGVSFVGIIVEAIYWFIYSWNHDNLTEMQMAKIATPYCIPWIIVLIIGVWLIYNYSTDYDRFVRKIERYKRNAGKRS